MAVDDTANDSSGKKEPLYVPAVSVKGVKYCDMFHPTLYRLLLSSRAFQVYFKQKNNRDITYSACSFELLFESFDEAKAATSAAKTIDIPLRRVSVHGPRWVRVASKDLTSDIESEAFVKHCPACEAKAEALEQQQASGQQQTSGQQSDADGPLDDVAELMDDLLDNVVAIVDHRYSRELMLSLCPDSQIPMPNVRRLEIPDDRFHRTVPWPLMAVVKDVTRDTSRGIKEASGADYKSDSGRSSPDEFIGRTFYDTAGGAKWFQDRRDGAGRGASRPIGASGIGSGPGSASTATAAAFGARSRLGHLPREDPSFEPGAFRGSYIPKTQRGFRGSWSKPRSGSFPYANNDEDMGLPIGKEPGQLSNRMDSLYDKRWEQERYAELYGGAPSFPDKDLGATSRRPNGYVSTRGRDATSAVPPEDVCVDGEFAVLDDDDDDGQSAPATTQEIRRQQRQPKQTAPATNEPGVAAHQPTTLRLSEFVVPTDSTAVSLSAVDEEAREQNILLEAPSAASKISTDKQLDRIQASYHDEVSAGSASPFVTSSDVPVTAASASMSQSADLVPPAEAPRNAVNGPESIPGSEKLHPANDAPRPALSSAAFGRGRGDFRRSATAAASSSDVTPKMQQPAAAGPGISRAPGAIRLAEPALSAERLIGTSRPTGAPFVPFGRARSLCKPAAVPESGRPGGLAAGQHTKVLSSGAISSEFSDATQYRPSLGRGISPLASSTRFAQPSSKANPGMICASIPGEALTSAAAGFMDGGGDRIRSTALSNGASGIPVAEVASYGQWHDTYDGQNDVTVDSNPGEFIGTTSSTWERENQENEDLTLSLEAELSSLRIASAGSGTGSVASKSSVRDFEYEQSTSAIPGLTYNDQWYYVDPSGREQGPFENHQMLQWYNVGFFKDELRVRRCQDRSFSTIGEYTRSCGTLPFMV